jgi:hypothetical protein
VGQPINLGTKILATPKQSLKSSRLVCIVCSQHLLLLRLPGGAITVTSQPPSLQWISRRAITAVLQPTVPWSSPRGGVSQPTVPTGPTHQGSRHPDTECIDCCLRFILTSSRARVAFDEHTAELITKALPYRVPLTISLEQPAPARTTACISTRCRWW